MNNIQEANKALCRAVGDLALAIVHMGDAAKEELDPARPSYQIGDKSVIEHVPGMVNKFAEIGDTIQITGNVQAVGQDGASSYWLFVGSTWEVTSIIDDWLVVTSDTALASYRIQRNGGGYEVIEKDVKQPEVAQVGDTVRRQDGAVFVVRLRSDSVWSGVVGFDINGTGVEHSARDGEYIIVQCATDKCEGETPEPSTAKLVDMLAKREGVSETSVDPHDAYSISDGAGEFGGTGPARILVVTD